MRVARRGIRHTGRCESSDGDNVDDGDDDEVDDGAGIDDVGVLNCCGVVAG